jgi:hypothetical protein
MDPQLKAQCRQTVTYAKPLAPDAAGQVSYGAAKTYCARVEPMYRDFSVGAGTQEKTSHMIILDECFPITESEAREMQLWLPGDVVDASTARRAKIVRACYGEFGTLDHWEILV